MWMQCLWCWQKGLISMLVCRVMSVVLCDRCPKVFGAKRKMFSFESPRLKWFSKMRSSSLNSVEGITKSLWNAYRKTANSAGNNPWHIDVITLLRNHETGYEIFIMVGICLIWWIIHNIGHNNSILIYTGSNFDIYNSNNKHVMPYFIMQPIIVFTNHDSLDFPYGP